MSTIFSYGFSGGESSRITAHPLPPPHHDLELMYVNRGGATLLYNGIEYPLDTGQTALFWGALPHHVSRVEREGHYSYVHIPFVDVLSWGISRAVIHHLLNGSILVAGPGRLDDGERIRIWLEDLCSSEEAMLDIVALELEARIRRFFLEEYRSAGGAGERGGEVEISYSPQILHPRVKEMIHYISVNFNRPIGVQDVADHVGLAPGYAMSLIKRESGNTITAFVNWYRVWYAARALYTSGLPITRIAFDAGFGSISQFNLEFKKIVGRSPRALRAAVKGLYTAADPVDGPGLTPFSSFLH